MPSTGTIAVLASPRLALKFITTDCVRRREDAAVARGEERIEVGIRARAKRHRDRLERRAGRLQLVAEPPCAAKLARLAVTGTAAPPTSTEL